MRSKWHKTAAVAGTGLALAVAGCGGSEQATSQTSGGTQPSAPAQGTQAQGGGPDAMAAALAEELGVSEAKVTAALEKVMPQGGGPPSGGQAPADDSTSSAQEAS